VALVTGSGQGIGRAIAHLLAQEGAAVVTNSRSPESPDATTTAADTAAEIVATGGLAEPVFADVGTMAGAAHLVSRAIERFGSIDIVVNNAATWSHAPVEAMTEEEWDAVIAVNLKGTFATAHWALPHMKARGWGRIVNIISRVGLAGAATMSSYAAAKAGVVGFTYSLAKEVSADAITVNCVAPTAHTVRTLRTAEERYAMIGRAIPPSPNRTPERVAPLVAYLASDAAAGINGQVFYAAAGEITLHSAPAPVRTLIRQGAWTIEELGPAFAATFGTTLGPPEAPLPPM
jgi:NAD(P)-dependent dehydrogenase (short-subunit alcohol dehydrogenase family)